MELTGKPSRRARNAGLSENDERHSNDIDAARYPEQSRAFSATRDDCCGGRGPCECQLGRA